MTLKITFTDLLTKGQRYKMGGRDIRYNTDPIKDYKLYFVQQKYRNISDENFYHLTTQKNLT